MPEFQYAKGRIGESLQFISLEMIEFSQEYSDKTWNDYQQDKKVQKLIDRTVENILTALIEVSGTILVEENIAVENYADALKKCAKLFNFSEEEQENMAKLAIARNRLAHRYLNFRWQVINMYKTHSSLIQRLLAAILEREGNV
ncbi:MAG: HepT-like ribonuclease domain-containing protein [Candidatus Desantisbacteria bacterium]